MRKTTFAGLTSLDPGEPLTTDGGSFLNRNPDITDHFLRLGAKTHVHDGRTPLADPATAPALVVDAAGGTLPPDTTITAVYTLLDADGGETLPSPAASVTTDAPIAPPVAPTLTLDTIVGALVADVYAYLVTLVDGQGGETTAGTVARITRDPGPANAQVTISDLDVLASAPGATGWRLYRAKGSGEFDLLATGDATDATFVDNGLVPVDCGVQPPDANSTNGANQVTITLPPGGVPIGAAGWRLYVTTSGDFTSPSLVGTTRLPGTSEDPIVLGSIAVDDGAPPDVSTSVGSPSKILATDEIDWTGYIFPSGGGGGGGGGGPLKVVPPAAIGPAPVARGATLAEYAAAWLPGAAIVAQLAEGDWDNGYEISTGYDPADWTGDTGAFSWDATGAFLDTSGAAGTHIIVTPATYTTGLDGYAELDYTIVGDGWDRIFAGVASNDGATGLAAMIDHASGTLSIIEITAVSPLAYTTLATIGAADGYAPPAIGDSASLYLQQYRNTVFVLDSRLPALVLQTTLPPDGNTLGVGPNRGLLGAEWTTPGDLTSPYLGIYTVPHTLEVAVVALSLVTRPGEGYLWEIANVGNQPFLTLHSNAEAWQNGVLTNAWAGAVNYRRFHDHLDISGTVNGGGAGTSILTIPAKIGGRPSRPAAATRVPIVTDAGASYVEIGTDGTVTPPAAAGNTRLDLTIHLPLN